jgi:serine/threonine-protein kinase RsbW
MAPPSRPRSCDVAGPGSSDPDAGGANVVGPGHHIALSIRLPRDASSVPLIRHLVRHTLEQIAVVSEVRGDIELALTEACSNVLRHAGPGDDYDVSVSVGPDTCELQVVDVGHGFDYETVQVEEPDAEQGRGLRLMRLLVDRIELVSAPKKGTLVRMVKALQFDPGSTHGWPLREALTRPEETG